MQSRYLVTLVSSALVLSGCVAAAIPVLAGGAMVRSSTRGHGKAEAGKKAPAPAPQAMAVAAPIPAQTPVALPKPLPSDAGQLKAGQLYAGTLPPPGPPPAVVPAPAPVATLRPSPTASWSDVGHFVSANQSPEHSVLLARGSATADPQWLACAGKPLAVLAAASTVLARGRGGELDPGARSWLEAWRVFSVGAVLVAADPAEAAWAKAAFVKAGLSALVDGDTLLLASSADRYPAIRAAIGARYCVTALVGRSAEQFPNGLTPGTTPPVLRSQWGQGWFLLADPDE